MYFRTIWTIREKERFLTVTCNLSKRDFKASTAGSNAVLLALHLVISSLTAQNTVLIFGSLPRSKWAAFGHFAAQRGDRTASSRLCARRFSARWLACGIHSPSTSGISGGAWRGPAYCPLHLHGRPLPLPAPSGSGRRSSSNILDHAGLSHLALFGQEAMANHPKAQPAPATASQSAQCMRSGRCKRRGNA